VFNPNRSISSIDATRPVVNPGATQALFVDVLPGQIWTQIKNIGNTGGIEVFRCSSAASLSVGATLPFTAGSTLTAAQLVAMSGTGYPLAANEILSLDGACRMYVNAPSASCQIGIIKGLAPGV
jgi:hypothetical protein